MHTEEPSPELLAWPLGPAIPWKEPPPTLPLGLMTKAAPRARALPLYGPIEAKLPPPRPTYVAAIPGKSPPPSPNAVVNRDGQSIPPLHVHNVAQDINANGWPPLAPEVELPPTIPPPKWRPSAKAGASDPKAHSQLMPLSKCGVVAMRPELAPPCNDPQNVRVPGDERPPHPSLLECITKMSLMSDDEYKLTVEQLSPLSEEDAPEQSDGTDDEVERK